MQYEDQHTHPDPDNSTKTILVVEDDEGIGPVLVDVLSQETMYKAIWVPDGLQALQLVKAIKPALLITDYWLPYINGIELYDRLHAMPDFSTTPAIIISAYLPEKDIRERHLDAISKPFELDELLDTVEKLIA